ncbi:hypothetical protein BC937DRAFT_89983 [Endogone sp. FLAS-F59071]|nr:hypothetical protein BC937DRAFT_89983 [Endogone sp. FLAS-F59071]|eukprot:RUS17434.1 hypothetical protein BC937DRAFT_89983 [Endogone sp. FLAS-F59071]
MLKFDFAFQDVVCDENTKRQVGQLCEFDDMGEQFVKGKAKPVRIYKVLRFASDASRKSSVSVTENVDFIGYKSEMDTATCFINGWIAAKNQHCIIVAGPSGAGKSYFCSTIQSIVSAENVFICVAQANEVKFIMLHLFDILSQGVVPKAEACMPLSPSTIYNDDSLSARAINPEFQKRFTQHAMFKPTPSPEVLSELVDLARRCLIICGEDESVLPLFKGLFPQFEIPESAFTCILDVQSKEMLLANLVQRMIRYVSSQVDLMIFCDDIQWADTASANMLVSIHETCPRVFLLMASRPVKDYKVTFVGELHQSGTCLAITLNGLGSEEIGAIVLQTEGFKKGVSKVSPHILRVIKKHLVVKHVKVRTGYYHACLGKKLKRCSRSTNHDLIRNMALVLKDFDHVTVVEGELVPQSHAFDLENLIGNFDYKRVIRMQFDRLDSAFQEFLKFNTNQIASCLDVNFTMAEVRTAISVNNPIFYTNDAQQIDGLLEQYDKYNYLVKVGDTNLAERRVGELLGGGDMYTFAHVTIPQSIYDTIPYETRRRYHRSLARFYEARLREGNASNLLVKITRHYQETEDIQKQLRYLEMLADYHMRSYFLSEATAALKQIVKILEENEQHAKEFGRLHLSDIYQRLGECLSMRTDLDQGQSYLFKALECLGKPWPKRPIAFTFSIFKERIEQQYRTKLRRHYRRQHTTVIEASDAEIYRRVANIMRHLTNVHYYTGQGQDFVLACLMGLNACERLGSSYPYHSTFLVRFALLCWINDDQIAAISLLRRGSSDSPDAITLCIWSYICFAAGRLAPARDTLMRAIGLVRVCGVVTDCQVFYRAVSLAAAIGIFGGEGCDPGLMKVMAETAHINGDYGAEIWLSLFHIAEGIVADDLRSCDPYVTLLEGHWERTKGFDRIAVRGVLMAYYARLRRREVALKHFGALAAVLPSLTVSANLIPVYGLIFATMALYELSEAGALDAEAVVDPRFFERLIVNVRTLNAAFQRAKFWEFTKPCLYLARALPYICTGRTVEGSLVLRHGLMEMEFIHEIRFLKAYYWAKLGRYAFQAADRSEWTGHARAELAALGIPHEVYCGVSTPVTAAAVERVEGAGIGPALGV